MHNTIEQAVTILKQGGIVIYPTDTAFGIGCRIDNEASVKKLFTIRKRPEMQATPVLVGSIGMAGEYLIQVPDDVEQLLMKQYWPGALTIVLHSKVEKIPSLVRGGTETLGVRMPNHDIALSLIREVGVPLLGPSANFHGEKTPYTFEELNPELKKLVDYVIPGECQTKMASTVIDCSVNPWKILRQGAVELKL
jgi:L-threonylcarbamoyladenylate synthase